MKEQNNFYMQFSMQINKLWKNFFLLFFHALIGVYGVYRSKVRPVVENPDSQFVAMPQSITHAGIELNPITEPIEEPAKPESEFSTEQNK